MSEALAVTDKMVNSWAERDDVVALHLRQILLPVEGPERAVIFPPTYANIGYNIDELPDGTKVATVDSVGSQANRMEPIFKREPYSGLVPQVKLVINANLTRSLLDVAHRAADATVFSCPGLAEIAGRAFESLAKGDAWNLCCLAPTSLVFGVWDSRGESGQKRPRLIRSIVRAWGVQPLHGAAQFNSVWGALGVDQREEMERAAKAHKTKLSDHGFKDAPAIFRKIGTGAAAAVPEYRDGNSERRVLGGVLCSEIVRDVTVNLAALRTIPAKNERESQIRRYLLALTLLAATAEIDWNLREGCNLRPAAVDRWAAVPRRGEPAPVELGAPAAQSILLRYAAAHCEPFRPEWPKELEYTFDVKRAAKLLKKRTDADEAEAEEA